MTTNNDRKTEARTIASTLGVNYTAALRLLERRGAALNEKVRLFPEWQIQPGGLLTWGEVDPAFPETIHKQPWNWHPTAGFTRAGVPGTPKALTGSRWMDEDGMIAHVAFDLGAGLGTSTGTEQYREDTLEYIHPAVAIAREADYLTLDLSLLAQLGFAARGTGWIIDSFPAREVTVRAIASAMALLLRDTADTARPDKRLLFIADTIEAKLAGVTGAQIERDEEEEIKSGYSRVLRNSRARFDRASYSASVILSDLNEPIEPRYYGSAKRLGFFFGVVGPERSDQFISTMAAVFAAMNLAGPKGLRSE